MPVRIIMCFLGGFFAALRFARKNLIYQGMPAEDAAQRHIKKAGLPEDDNFKALIAKS